MRSLRLLIAAVIAIGSASVVASAGVLGITQLNEATLRRSVSAAVSSVVAATDVGEIDVRAGSPTTVVAVSRWNLVRPTVTVSEQNGVLVVRARCPDQLLAALNECSVDLTLTIPETASLGSEAGVGSIRATGLRGSRVVARTGVGSIALSGLRSAEVSASTGTGSITAVLDAAAGLLALDTGVGDIDATVPAGTHDVEASTGVGSVTITGISDVPSAANRIRAQTGTGSILLTGR